MQASDIPVKFPIAFANAAGAGYIRTIPVNSQIGTQDGAASLTDGFPPLTFIPVGSGGVPPFGQDVNGILKEITSWTRWSNAGGMVVYDATFSTSIGGYPQGALLLKAAGNGFWLSTADNNVTDPDTGGAGWQSIVSVPSDLEPQFESAGAAGTADPYSRADHSHPNNYCGVSTGTTNAQVILKPNGLAALADGTTLSFTAGFTNAGAATLQVGSGGGALGPLSIVKDTPAGPIALAGGEIVAPNEIWVQVKGTSFHLLNPALGNAAQANATSGTGKVVAFSGPAVIGNLPVFSDVVGTEVDSGVSPGSLAGSAEGVLYQLGQTF